MKVIDIYGKILVVVALLLPISVLAKSVGVVDFPVQCQKSSQPRFNDALAQVHNMMYVQANQAFSDIIAKDPQCAMAFWGRALSVVHPLWADQPSEQTLKAGQADLEQAWRLTRDQRERAYIKALQAYFRDWQQTKEPARIKNWESAQRQLMQRYPNDPDAVALFALTHLATAPKEDKAYRHQQRAGHLLEALHEKHPQHPAGFHYTIHAYDNPLMAAKALSVARGYDKIAPDVPHALHMPSHIFVRLGLWQDTVAWNIRSATAAKNQPLPSGEMSMHYAHALDYLMYAYLQQGQFAKAKEVLDELNAVDHFQQTFPSAYGIAAARARFYLEQRQWQNAAALPEDKPAGFPWQRFPAAHSITLFAKGVGAAKSDQLLQAKKMVTQLNTLYLGLVREKQMYWATLVNAKRKVLLALIADQKGHKAAAIELMKVAADTEDSVDKHPVTPAEVLPARELYAHMLLEDQQYGEALKAFQKSLLISPNRPYSLYGAAQAAEKLGDKLLALRYYRDLVALSQYGDDELVMVKTAREYLQQNKRVKP